MGAAELTKLARSRRAGSRQVCRNERYTRTRHRDIEPGCQAPETGWVAGRVGGGYGAAGGAGRRPCTVAVVGQVKVGKSTFVNALLGGDHAKVGSTETTATINYFSHVSPESYDPERPVRCYWRGGGFSDKSRAFLDGLQGNDLETLQRADGIERRQYRLPNALLEQITLVDTPGTGR